MWCIQIYNIGTYNIYIIEYIRRNGYHCSFFFWRNESLAKQGQVLVIKSQSYNIKITMSNVHKMVKHTLRILQLMLSRVFHYFLDTRHDRIGTLNDAKKFEVGRRMRSFCFVFLSFFVSKHRKIFYHYM